MIEKNLKSCKITCEVDIDLSGVTDDAGSTQLTLSDLGGNQQLYRAYLEVSESFEKYATRLTSIESDREFAESKKKDQD